MNNKNKPRGQTTNILDYHPSEKSGCMVPLLIIILLFLASCRTVKNIDRVEYRTDSTALRQVDSLTRLYKLDSAGWTNLISQLSNNTVIFQDTGSSRVEYYPDGQLKVVEGRLRSVNAKLLYEASQSAHWRTLYDSISHITRKDSVSTRVEYVTVSKTVKRTVLPWYWWLIMIVAVGAGYYLKRKSII